MVDQPSSTSTSPAPITPVEPGTQVFLGVGIQLGEKTFFLEPKKAISDIKKYGLEIGLPEGQTIQLGSVRTGVNGILDTISPGTRLPEKAAVPEMLQSGWDTLLSAEIAVTDFHVKVPGTESKIPGTEQQQTTTQFTVGLSATWQGDKGKLFGNVKLRGIFVTVSNEKVAVDPA